MKKVKKVNILEARNNLSKLVSAVGNGEDIVIANRGKPVARLVAVDDGTLEHTARQAVEWLTTNPVPQRATRSAAALDRQIASEREGWE